MDADGLGAQFARALTAKDFERVITLFDPEVEFRGVTPRKFWEADDPETLVAELRRRVHRPNRTALNRVEALARVTISRDRHQSRSRPTS